MVLASTFKSDLGLEEVLEFARAQRARASRLTDELLTYLEERIPARRGEPSDPPECREEVIQAP